MRILESGVDILYIHSPECAWPFTFVKSPIPVIYHQHGSANPVSVATHKWARNRFFSEIFDSIHKTIYKRADWIIAIDQLSLAQAKQNGAAQKVSLIMNAVDTSIFRPDSEIRKHFRKGYECNDRQTILLFAGRLEEVKRVDRIIASLSYMHDLIDIKLFIAGDGSLKGKLEDQVNRMNLQNKVFFLGYAAHNKLPGLYNMADALMLPSIMEGTPMVILEALACGTPVLATPVGGIPGLIKDGENGFLLRDISPNSIATVIEGMVANNYDRGLISESVQRWSAKNVAGELTQLFQELAV
jgi:glycosyltransferase involved in cell wall biosynthesis